MVVGPSSDVNPTSTGELDERARGLFLEVVLVDRDELSGGRSLLGRGRVDAASSAGEDAGGRVDAVAVDRATRLAVAELAGALRPVRPGPGVLVDQRGVAEAAGVRVVG